MVSVDGSAEGARSAAAGVRPVSPADVAPLGACLARAFWDDPVSVYIFPHDRSRQRRLERYFRWQLSNVFLPRGEAWTTDDLAGASLWMPQRSEQPGIVASLVQLASAAVILGSRLPSAFGLLGQLEPRHPRQPHCYLGTIGTDPGRQRAGVGSALMQVVLDRLDQEGTPAYLESSKEENLAFYHRHGFSVTGEAGAVNGLPRLWLMWREPRPPASP
jgi:ribosomal protein S18 acetylase RimI-like enzyme